MTIQYAVPIADKSHVLHVGLLVPASLERVDPVTKAVTMVDGIQEIPVRKSHYNSLTTSGKLAYVKQCAEVHHSTDRAKAIARRALWEADDRAKADAAAEAAKLAKEAIFDMKQQGHVRDDKGQVVGVNVVINWQGFSCTAMIPADPANAEANGKAAWQTAKTAYDAEQASLAAFNFG